MPDLFSFIWHTYKINYERQYNTVLSNKREKERQRETELNGINQHALVRLQDHKNGMGYIYIIKIMI